ncbi:hypothetical protein ACGFJ7_45275 [Actinoplanes sp. NPDC048988]|uniref:hypothetical protein n=1 Tax=Actinoplanes sp. NPDC048988 TaxID=3363901 RepID=UPI00371590AF
MFRGLQSSVVGKLAVGALVIVLSAGTVLGLSVLLRGNGAKPSGPAALAGASASPGRPSVSASPRRSPSPRAATSKPAADRPSRGPAPPSGGAADVAAPRPSNRSGVTAASAKPSRQAGATTKPSPKVVTYTNVAGLGCTINGASYVETGFYENGDAGWWTLSHGSHAGDGCDGRFTDMPMSGSQSDTSGQHIMWGFSVGSVPQYCSLALYVPNSASARDVAAKSAHFAVVQGNSAWAPTYTSPSGERVVNQNANRNRWVGLGTYPVRNGAIGVKLTNRGSTTGYDVTYPHLAGGAVRINCVKA